MRMMTAAKRFGLYSALRACRAIFFRSNLQVRLTVQTMFLKRSKNIIICNTVVFSVYENVQEKVGEREGLLLLLMNMNHIHLTVLCFHVESMLFCHKVFLRQFKFRSK